MRIPALLLSFALLLVMTASASSLSQVAMVEIPGPPGFDAMAFAGKYLLISHSGANSLEIFDPKLRRVVAQIVNLSHPRGIAVDAGSSRVYVANSANNTITEISMNGWKVLRSIPVPRSPAALLFVPQRQTLYACNPHDDSVTALNVSTGATQNIPLRGVPQSMVYAGALQTVFVSLQGNSAVAALDAANTVERSFAINAPEPAGIAYNPSNNHLYLAVRGAVVVLDPQTGAELGRVPVPESIASLWLDETSNTLYTASEDGAVDVIRDSNGQFTDQDEFKTDVRGHLLAFDPSRKYLYVPGGREDRSKVVILRAVGTAGLEKNAQAASEALASAH